MPTARYLGPKPKLTIRATGTVLRRGRPSTVTHREARLLADAADRVKVEVGPAADFGALTVPELRRLCRREGLDSGGRKADLVARLDDTTVGDDPPEPDV